MLVKQQDFTVNGTDPINVLTLELWSTTYETPDFSEQRAVAGKVFVPKSDSSKNVKGKRNKPKPLLWFWRITVSVVEFSVIMRRLL
jgi:hypothetical protein